MDRRFKGVWIPKALWLTRDLSLTEKVMLVEIDSLDDEQRGCFASNGHLAEFFDLSQSRVSEIISALAAKGFISVEQTRQGVRTVRRTIRVIKGFEDKPSSTEKPKDFFGKGDEGSSEKAEGSNTGISNTEDQEHFRNQQADRIPYEAIFQAYAAALPELPQLKIKDDSRRKAIKMICTMDDRFYKVESWQKFFKYVRASQFLMNMNGIGFDWLLKKANFKKVLEGNYHEAKKHA